MMTNELRKLLQLTVLALLASVVAAGCGGGNVSIEEECSRCGEDSASIAACIESDKNNKKAFESIGCDSEFQSLIDCAFDNSTCTAQKTSTPDGCEQERFAILRCAGVL